MLEFHAKTMLLAIDFWKLRFNDCYDKWKEEYDRLQSEEQTERLPKASISSKSDDESDNGYYSDGESV